MKLNIFRAWSKSNKEMFYPESNAQLFNLIPFSDFIIMQYIGLKVDGTYVYEADVLLCKKYRYVRNLLIRPIRPTMDYNWIKGWDEVTLIGNRFENPEIKISNI